MSTSSVDWDAVERGEVHESPDRSVAEHVRRYLATDGADGYTEGGATNLVLTTVGRRTGRLHRTGLFFGEDAGRYVLVASGSALSEAHPHWYHNLVAHPEAHVQVRGDRFLVQAHTAEGAERERLWRMMVAMAPIYRTQYERRLQRTIPVVVLEPVRRLP